jgi:diaminohydroxyphosphoribosylaminopyrimidine deaminase/5-amino-6-(5-phosphoribosylamino)uracil reductase
MIRWFNHPKDELLRDLKLPPVGTSMDPEAACSLALAVALRGVGAVSPNPLVGAVLVDRTHCFLAAGAHDKVGELHAEAKVLKIIREQGLAQRLEGAKLYVTLEPCAHEGRTPSCARTLVGTGIREVVYGLTDPNPLVAGKGAQILREAGIEVVDAAASKAFQLWSDACADLAAVFLHNVSTGRIFTGIKLACSLDGVVAFEGDRRVWITGDRARAYGHWLRMWYDAVAVGAGTVLADNPRLDVRHHFLKDHVPVRTPRRVVFDPRGRAFDAVYGGDSCNLIHVEPHTTIWLMGDSPESLSRIKRGEALGISAVPVAVDPSNGLFLWEEVERTLQDLGVRSLLLEGGPGLHSVVLGDHDARVRALLQKLHLFQSPVILGNRSPEGARALRWTGGVAGRTGIRQDLRQLIELEQDWGIELTFELV